MTDERRDVAERLAREIIDVVVDFAYLNGKGGITVHGHAVGKVAALLHPVRHRTSGLVERLEALLSRSTLRHDVEPSVAMTAGERTALREAARILREPSEGREPDGYVVLNAWNEIIREVGTLPTTKARAEQYAGKVFGCKIRAVYIEGGALRFGTPSDSPTGEPVPRPHPFRGYDRCRICCRAELHPIHGIDAAEDDALFMPGLSDDEIRRRLFRASDSPEREGPDAVGLLSSWLSSETQQIRDSFVPHNEKLIPSRVDAHWSANDPDGFALAVATRKYLDRVGFEAPGDGGDTSDENAPPNGEAPHARVTEAPEAARLRNEDNESDAPEPAKSEEPDPGCSECNDWFAPGMGDHAVTAESPECPIRGERCVRYPAAEPAESEETTHQCRDCGWTGSRSDLRDDQLDDGTPLKVCGNLACLSSEIEPYPETGAAPSPEGVEAPDLRAAIIEAVSAGRAAVDEALREFGYDSLRFADVRHGWLETVRVFDKLVPEAKAEAVDRATRTTEPEPGTETTRDEIDDALDWMEDTVREATRPAEPDTRNTKQGESV